MSLPPLSTIDRGETDGGRVQVEVAKEYVINLGDTGNGLRISVPTGFRTDYASIPRPFWSMFPPHGLHGRAAVVHDYLYREKTGISRLLADAIFRELMKLSGVTFWKRCVIYYAVRLFGSAAYKGNA